MLYTLARGFLKLAKKIWSGLFIAIAVGGIANILVADVRNLSYTVFVIVFQWLLIFGLYQNLVLGILGLFVIFTVVAWIITAIEEHREGGRALKKYLRAIADKYQDIKPVGFAQQSALISVSVPLDDIFIHLRAISDRPRYDMPAEQRRWLEELRQRSDLSPQERERQVQALRVVWYSQLGKELVEIEQPPKVAIEDVIQQLTAEQPGAVILGTPGSGKSTTLRWFAYHMARAFHLSWYHEWFNVLLHFLNRRIDTQFTWGYYLPKELAPKQIPILIRISDYAEALSEAKNGHLSFETFFLKYFEAVYPNPPRLANRLLQELQNGRCLLLLDGLDEVASDELRRRITENIFTFIVANSSEKGREEYHNRFIITSRIVGYETRSFANYAHYTLQDLEDEQVEQFLTNWCLAVEHYQITSPQGRKGLTAQQKFQADKDAIEQRERLLEVLRKSPSIKRLAVNPLMLTILALLQRSGKTLPQRRINLYQVVTRTLLDNWNQDTGRKVFPSEEIPLAEDMLGRLAYELHKSNLLLTEEKVKVIAYEAMKDFYHKPPSDNTIKRFIDTLRSSSGLFVESGQGFFSFMHRTFQEYFVSLHLLNQPPDQLEQFIQIHCHIPIWHEPLLLLIAYKSEQITHEEQEKVNRLINIIANTNSDYDVILHRSLLFVANIIADCSAWTIDYSLQQRVAYGLFELYGDSLSVQRYAHLKEDIEKIALLWLRGQPVDSSDARPPLLEIWRTVLCDPNHLVRQKGAVHLLASIAIELPGCPKLVLSALIPPLLQLASLQELPCPRSIRTQLPQPAAKPGSTEITEHAFVTLRLLDAEGPAGWLHKAWLQWNNEHPEFLERLTKHSLELDYLLTPVALTGKSDNIHWRERITLSRYWQELARGDPRHFQRQLLSTHDAAGYPYAYLFKQALEMEMASPSTPWRDTWDTFLKQEMMRGRNATYQACLHLRLLLHQEDMLQRQSIANELMDALSIHNQAQMALALIAIANMFWFEVRTPRYLQEFREPWLRERHQLLNMRDILDIQKIYLQYLQKLRERRNLRYLREQRYLATLKEQLDLRNIQRMWEVRNIRHLVKLLDLRDVLDAEKIVLSLCTILKQQVDEMSSTILITLYSILATTSSTAPFQAQVWKSIQKFEQQAQQTQLLNREHRLLIATLAQFLGITQTSQIIPTSPLSQETPEELVTAIYTLKERKKLTEQDTEKILRASIDTRKLSVDKQLEIYANTSIYLDTVQAATWEILNQPFTLEGTALSTLLWYLDSNDPILCAAAATLAQYSTKKLSPDLRKQLAKKIAAALNRDVSSYRPLQPSDSIKVWRQDDILFEALNALTT